MQLITQHFHFNHHSYSDYHNLNNNIISRSCCLSLIYTSPLTWNQFNLCIIEIFTYMQIPLYTCTLRYVCVVLLSIRFKLFRKVYRYIWGSAWLGRYGITCNRYTSTLDHKKKNVKVMQVLFFYSEATSGLQNCLTKKRFKFPFFINTTEILK